MVSQPAPIPVVGRWAALAVGDNHSAGLSCEGGQLYTWGANHRGQLGHGERGPALVDTPTQVVALADMDVK